MADGKISGAAGRPKLDGIYGSTANPLRQIYMMGVVWWLSEQDDLNNIRILEVGSWCGASALTWGEAIKFYVGGQGTITCVDAWEPYVDLCVNPGEDNQSMEAALVAQEPFEVFKSNMQFLPTGVTYEIERGWSSDILPALTAESYDLVYIDGDHTYQGVLSDLQHGQKLVRPGGILCGDDLELQARQCDLSILDHNPEIDKHFDSAHQLEFHPGVAKAIAETLGEVSSWSGFWAMQKTATGWRKISLDGMPARIPSHIHPESLIGLKALLMQSGIL